MKLQSRAWIFGVVACVLTLALGAMPAHAGEKSLIAGFRTGDEVRYILTVRGDETTSVIAQPGNGAHALSTETVGVLVRCKADTVPLTILEVVYESFRITLDSPQGKVDVDLAAPLPETASSLAKNLHAHLHAIVGTTVTINLAPGSGEITLFHGHDALLKAQGASMLRRYLDRDLFTSTFGPIFQLKSNSAAPPAGEKWYVQRNIFAYAHPGKSPVWETRVVEGVVGDIATIKGNTRAAGDPAGAEKAPAFFKTVNGESTFTWDLLRGRLLSATRTEVINSRYVLDSVNRDSDLITKLTLELVKPADKKPDAPAAIEPPAKVKP